MEWIELFFTIFGRYLWEGLKVLFNVAAIIGLVILFIAGICSYPLWTLITAALLICGIRSAIETRNEIYAAKASLDYAFVQKAWQDYVNTEPEGLELCGDKKAKALYRYDRMLDEFNSRYPHLAKSSNYYLAGSPIWTVNIDDTSES